MNQVSPTQDEDSEISLVEIIDFLTQSWKKLIVASIVGAVLGLAGWFFLGQYSAEYILLNNSNNNNSYALDLVSWKMLQKSLPNLAAQVAEEGRAPEGQQRIYKLMAEEQWWQKNISPAFALSKADAKDLAGITKDLDAASTTILSLTLTADGASKEQSIGNVRAASKFLRSGGAYLQLRSLLNGYESQTISTVADLQQKITNTQIEMKYQVERAKSLEELHKRFPGGAAVNQQVVDPKDSGAKYMPIATQIIAVNNDINASKESLERLQKRLDQIGLVKKFIDQAIPLQDQTFDGLVLDGQLLGVESGLRSKLTNDDSNGRELLDQLHAQLLAIQVRFTKGLESNTSPNSIKKGMIKTMVGGFFGAFFLMLLALLGKRVWHAVKSGGAK